MASAPFMLPGKMGMLLGTDSLGRDVAAGIAHGARISLLVGVFLGAIAGYVGGSAADAIMRFTEFFQTIPSFVLAILLVAIFTPSIGSVVFAIAVVSWPPVARVAAKVLGKSRISIVLGDILPNALSPIIVLSSLMVAAVILLGSALSFLGVGDPNLRTLGLPERLGPQRHPAGLVDARVSGDRHLPHGAVAEPGGGGLSDALNPLLPRCSRCTAWRVRVLMEAVNLPDPAAIARSHPFCLSGGQRQRVMIAMALVREPALPIEDEPTTALDVTTQMQILRLIREIQSRRGMGALFITHDFGVVAEIADRVAVMQRGAIVEQGPTAQVFSAPRHAYTWQLLDSIPGRGWTPPQL